MRDKWIGSNLVLTLECHIAFFNDSNKTSLDFYGIAYVFEDHFVLNTYTFQNAR